MSETAAATAATNGWDLVYAIYYADVNRSILQAWNDPKAKLPTTFHLKSTVEDKPASIDGSFDPWRLVTGGGGPNLKFALPISAVTVVVDFLAKTKRLEDLTAVIEVELDFVPPDLASAMDATAPPRRQHLRMNTASKAVSEPAITSNDGTKIDEFVLDALQDMLKDWLNSNLQEFTYVFHTVDLPEKIAQAHDPSLAWLAPTAMHYAVAEPGVINGIPTATENNSVFGILVMTEGRINLNPVSQVSPFAIPADAGAALLVSKERFLTRFLLGGIHTLFKSATPADFMVTLDGATITNQSDQAFDDMTITDDSGHDKTVSPNIKAEDFTVNFLDQSLFIQLIDFHWQYSPGIDVYTDYTTNADISVDAYGKLHLNVRNTGVSKGMIVTSKGLAIANIVDGILLGIAGGALGGFLGGAATAGKAVVAGVELGENLAVDGAEFVAEEAVTAEARAAAQATEKEALEQAAGEIAASTGRLARVGNALKGFLSRNWGKILGSMIGSGAGVAIAEIPLYLQIYANDDAQMKPTLAPFLDAVAVNMQWPNSVQPKVVSAQFNGCLQLGVDPGFRF